MYKMLMTRQVYSRVQDQRNSKIKQSYWSRATFWTQRLYTRVRVLGMEKKEVVLMWHHFPAKSRQAPLKNILLI